MDMNPFADYTLDIPNKFRSSVLEYSQSSGSKGGLEFSPFQRQVDFWYTAFLLGIKMELEPAPESDTYNATPGTIFSRDPYRIYHMQIAYLGRHGSLESLADTRKVFDYCLGIANAAMPYLIQKLSDPDDRPLWSLLDELEGLLS